MTATVLLVDDDTKLIRLLEHEIRDAGYNPLAATTGEEAIERFQRDEPDVVVLDLHLPDVSGIELLGRFRRESPEVPVVVLTAQGAVEAVVECMRLGAVDYVQKPFDRTRLITSVKKAHDHGNLQWRLSALTAELRKGEGFDRILGESPAIRRCVDLLKRAVASDVTVLLEGDSGTGKEVAARALHAESARRSGPFVAVNCGAIPEGLIESELFGHEKGAFTGATERRRGCFEQANGGTIFLDEIGELRTDLQVRLLRVLQERAIQRVGGTGKRNIDVRVLAATNRDLKAMASVGGFREDLYYRLAVFPVRLPPLRERSHDVLLLAEAFVQRFAKSHGRRIAGVTSEARRALESYDWPGNVRELENVLERAVILEDREAISLDSLPDEVLCAIDPGQPPQFQVTPQSSAGEAGAAVASAVPPPPAPSPETAEDISPLHDEECRLIRRALELTGWNIVEAARRLGIGRATIYRKIERYDLRAARTDAG